MNQNDADIPVLKRAKAEYARLPCHKVYGDDGIRRIGHPASGNPAGSHPPNPVSANGGSPPSTLQLSRYEPNHVSIRRPMLGSVYASKN
jgi:hypothetical protein